MTAARVLWGLRDSPHPESCRREQAGGLTIGELIDFYLSIQQPGSLVGFADLYGDEVEALKDAIQSYYGSQEAWLALPETEELPLEVEQQAKVLIKLFEDWKG